MNNNNFFTVQGWMVNDLNLKGNDLMIYAIIYGFSQDGQSEFTGSLDYLRKSLNISSKNTIMKSLNNLIENELIIKTEKFIDNVKLCSYRNCYDGISKNDIGYTKKQDRGISKNDIGYIKNCYRGISKNDINNIDNNININNTISKDIVDPKTNTKTSLGNSKTQSNIIYSDKKINKKNVYLEKLKIIREYFNDDVIVNVLEKYLKIRNSKSRGGISLESWKLILEKTKKYYKLNNSDIGVLIDKIESAISGEYMNIVFDNDLNKKSYRNKPNFDNIPKSTEGINNKTYNLDEKTETIKNNNGDTLVY